MGAAEITVIVVVSAFVATMIIVMTVRKLKGKPSLNSDCCDCPHCKECGGCAGCKGESVGDMIAEINGKRASERDAASSPLPSNDAPDET